MRLRLSGLVALLLLVVMLTAACGVKGDGATATTGSPGATTGPATSAGPGATAGPGTTVAQDSTKVSVYFSRDEKICPALRVVTATSEVEVAKAAVTELLGGPSPDEKAGGMAGSIPQGTKLLGLAIEAGIATVDLSGEFASGGGSLSTIMRLAEVVFTLTQFPAVTGVQLELDGKPVEVFGSEGLVLSQPMTRADFESLSPAILVESPLPGETVTSPVRVRGTSNTFEATCLVKIVDAGGGQVGFEVVTATSGSGERGTFDAVIAFKVDAAGPGTIVAYEESAEDGSVINEVRIPVQLAR